MKTFQYTVINIYKKTVFFVWPLITKSLFICFQASGGSKKGPSISLKHSKIKVIVFNYFEAILLLHFFCTTQACFLRCFGLGGGHDRT